MRKTVGSEDSEIPLQESIVKAASRDPEATGTLAPLAPSTPDEQRTLSEMIRRVMSSLPREEREIVHRWLAGMPATEISQQTGRPPKTIYRIVRKILRSLQPWPGEIEQRLTATAEATFPSAWADSIERGKNEPEESKLLERANEALPAGLKSRLAALEQKRDAGSLTEPEFSELISLSDRVEQLHAERLEALASLAKLRGSTLTSVMDHLGIRFPDNA